MSQQINLLRPKDRSTQFAIGAMVAVGLGLVAMLGYYQSLRMNTAALRNTAAVGDQRVVQIRNLIQALQKTKTSQGDGTSLNAEIHSLRPRAEAMAQMMKDVSSGNLGSPDGFSRYLDTLAAAGTEGLWLQDIAITKGGASVNLYGHALRSESVTRYAAKLHQSFERFGVRFNSLEVLPEAVSRQGGSTSGLAVVAFKIS